MTMSAPRALASRARAFILPTLPLMSPTQKFVCMMAKVIVPFGVLISLKFSCIDICNYPVKCIDGYRLSSIRVYRQAMMSLICQISLMFA
ncbi:hypothetical protein [Moraxella lacunata]|uniref:hypothetical protein n=1 Tax=Moraxella lacunata TaxID=477 RepID=UPI003EE29B19